MIISYNLQRQNCILLILIFFVFEEGTEPKETIPFIISSKDRGEPRDAKNFQVVLRHDGIKQQ